MKIYSLVSLTVACLCCIACFGQQAAVKPGNLVVVNRELTLPGNGSLHLGEADNAGFAWLKNREFKTGVIEFDAKGSDKLQGSFVGIAFHGVNDTTYECIYFRPFNFRATDSVRRSHGVQYIAVPPYDWPILRETYPNKYEQAVNPPPDPNAWFHARIVITPSKITVFVNGKEQAALVVEPLVKTGSTKIGYWAGNGSAGDWKNLKITDSK